MNQLELEDLIRQGLDDTYRRGANKLSRLKLSDILNKKNPYLVHAVDTQGASEIVGELLKIYLASFDEGIFGQTRWEELTEYPDFYQKLISLMNQKPTQHRLEFEKEWSKALNRFEYDFLINFGNDDGSIDWEKLLRYNSGKDKVV
jgi:Type II restriction endonuclease EcoO109I